MGTMLNQAVAELADHSWVPSSVWSQATFAEQKKAARKTGDCLENVPVMSATVLGLEILLNESCIDLKQVSDVILSDVGATIHILRLVGREYESAFEHPSRMADCLAGLDASAWFEVIAAQTFPCDEEHASVTALWSHCRLVAQYAQLVAESIDGVSTALTVCTRFRANVEDPWCSFDSVRSDVWCDLCAEALGLSKVA